MPEISAGHYHRHKPDPGIPASGFFVPKREPAALFTPQAHVANRIGAAGSPFRIRSAHPERAMDQPSKEQVRHWMQERAKEHKSPPDPKQLRRELGIDLLEAERKQQVGRR